MRFWTFRSNRNILIGLSKMDNSVVLLNFLIIVNYAAVTKPMDSVSDILSAEGYRNEVHSVTTFDKYILKLHRIPSDSISSKVVVILHGLGASSYAFVITGPGIPRKNSITFKLANHGCDVWLINVRGTDYSHHQHLLPTSSKYWQFSLDEIVKYDLPAIIDYVLMKTNQTFVHFVGHSQGTTVVMAMLSLFPRYNKKLKTLHLMAPSVYFTNAAPLLKTGVMFSEPLEDATAAVGIVKLPPISNELARLGGYLCSSKSPMTMEICKQIFYVTVGPSQHINQVILMYPTLTNIFQHIPNTVSVMQLLHFAQLIKGGDRFLQFDYKKDKNLLIYNQSTPPQYQLSNVRTKIHFLYGTTDLVTNYQDVEKLIEKFRPWTIGIDKISGYNHFDFLAAKNVDEAVNSKILDLINRYCK